MVHFPRQLTNYWNVKSLSVINMKPGIENTLNHFHTPLSRNN